MPALERDTSVLSVHGNEAYQVLLQHMLARLNFDVSSFQGVDTVENAVTVLKKGEKKPTFILLDLDTQDPDQTLTFLSMLKDPDSEYANTSLVAMGEDTVANREVCEQFSIQTFLPTPIAVSDFMSAIQSLQQ